MKNIWPMILLAGLMPLYGGCVAVKVAEPEVFTHTKTVVETAPAPVLSEVVGVAPKAEVDGNRLKAWLDAEVREEYQRWQHEETVTVQTQKRLAMGFFPGYAMFCLVPEGAMDHVRWYDYIREGRKGGGVVLYSRDGADWLFGLLIGVLWGNIDTMLLEPVSNTGWTEKQEVADFGNVQRLYINGTAKVDVSASPRMQALGKLSPWERERAGIITCFDVGRPESSFLGRMHRSGNGGLFGAFKYQDVFVDPILLGPVRPMENEKTQATRAVGGPYEVELRIPWAGIESKATVGAWESKATFILPQVETGGSYEATLTFRSLYTGTDDALRGAWDTRTLTQSVWLQEKPHSTPPAAQAPAREVVKEIHHYHETRVVEERKPEGAPWDIETVESFRGGRAVYLVKIHDASKKAFEVEREVRPEIERNLREAFVAAMPGMDKERVQACVVADYEGRAIRFRGVAFSAVPVSDGWTFNPDTMRGTVRLKISEGMTPQDMERWAKENIDAIVALHNVVLEAGKMPPPGAKSRFLSQNFSDGVLTVEFEAVE